MYYPAFLNLMGKDCVVIGGGEVALRKVNSLIDCGARVSVYSPEVIPELEDLGVRSRIVLEKTEYHPDHLVGAFLVICATHNTELNAAIALEARDRNLLVNVVDEPELCSFIVPSVLRRGKLAVAISTEGASPALARFIREKLEKEFGLEYEIFLEVMEKFRKKLVECEPDETKRRDILTKIVHSSLMDEIKQNKNADVQRLLEIQIRKYLTHENR